MATEGIYVGTVKKRMSKGTKLSSTPPVDTYVFDCAKGEFLDTTLLAQEVAAERTEEDAN